MTNAVLIGKKLAFIESSVRRLRTHAKLELIESDPREQGFVLHTLQLAIQAAIDAASHIVSDERVGEPHSYRDVFTLLGRENILPVELAAELERMVGLRNILVHAYEDVDLAIVHNIVTSHLDDLLSFAAHIRSLLR